MPTSHPMAAPNIRALTDALRRVAGDAPALALVHSAQAKLGLPGGDELSVEEVQSVSAEIASGGGVAAVVALSMRMRCDAYLALGPQAPPAGQSVMVDEVVSAARIAELAKLDLRSDRARAIFDELAAEAAEICRMPIGLVSVVLDSSQFFLGQHGLSGWLAKTRSTPVEWAFCANVVRSGNELIVSDARRDPLLAANPLVKADGVVCYAGVPLRMPSGAVLGTLCVISNKSEQISEERMTRLRILCRATVKRLQEESPRAT